MRFKKLRAFFSISNLYKVISHAYEVIACFILRRTNLNNVDKNGDTPLHRALNRLDNYKTIARLIKCGADVHAVNRNGDTPLHGIARRGMPDPSMAALLIEHGADVNAVDTNGYTPLHRAVLEYEYADLYYEFGRSCFFHSGNKSGFDSLKHEMLNVLMKHGANVNAVDNHGYTLIHNLAILNNLQRVAALIEHGADVNSVNNNGSTPLLSAAKNGHLEMVTLLLRHGADVNSVNNNGNTPLLSAAKNGHLEIVTLLLLRHGVDVNSVNNNGYTPLLSALSERKFEVAALLMEHGADVNVADKYGNKPLCYAVLSADETQERHLSIVRLLIIVTLLDNINAENPIYDIGRKQWILTLWADCKAEIEALSQVILTKNLSGTFSLLDLYKEKDENKLALISRNEEVKKILENLTIKEQYPYLSEKIQAQFQKGLARNQALGTACKSIFTFNTHRKLNEDCWEEILKNLSQEDLKNVTRVASLFFNKLPSNDNDYFSSAKQKQLELEEEKSKLEDQVKTLQETYT